MTVGDSRFPRHLKKEWESTEKKESHHDDVDITSILAFSRTLIFLPFSPMKTTKRSRQSNSISAYLDESNLAIIDSTLHLDLDLLILIMIVYGLRMA